MSDYNIKNFSAIVDTSQLPSKLSEGIKAAAIERLMEVVLLRKHFYVDTGTMDEGSSKYTYEVMDRSTAAYDRAQGTDVTLDNEGATESSVDVTEIMKGFSLTWPADNLKKIGMRVAKTKEYVSLVKDREDLKIATALIASSALTSTVSAAAALSASDANPIKNIKEAKRKVRALMGGVNPNLLLIEDENLEELAVIVGSNDWYKMTEESVRTGELPTFMGLKIVALPTGKLTHGTAVVCLGGPNGCLHLGQAHDTRIKIFDDNKKHATEVHVYERVAPAVVRADAGAKITGW